MQSSIGLDAGQYLYFGYEEGFGGSDTGGNDYGYITYDNNSTTYGSGAGETSALRIGTQNDGAGSVSDSIALEAAANIYLRPGSWGGSGEIYKGTYSSNNIMIHAGNISSYAAGSISGYNNPTTGATANTIVYRDSAGDIYGRYLFGSYHNSSDDVSDGSISYIMAKFGDNYYRSATAAKVATFISNSAMSRVLARASGISLGSGNSSQIEVNNAGSGACNISFHREGVYGAHFGLDTDNWFSTYGWSAGGGYTAMRVGSFAANGNITATGTVTAYYSDNRLKTRIAPITNALDKISTLNGFYFRANEVAGNLGYDTQKIQVGVSAQEVENILPEIIERAPISDKANIDYKTLDYAKLVPLLIESIKELNSKVDYLKNEVEMLKLTK